MRSIGLLGSGEQKNRWLPAMARRELLGAFALTEPVTAPTRWHWRPPPSGTATAYVVDGEKRWIGSSCRTSW